MTQYNGIMVDIETLGIGPGRIIGTIGAVAFNPAGGELGPEFSVRLDMLEQERLGMTISASTFIWWLSQSEEARAEMRSRDRLSVYEALLNLGAFIEKHLAYGGTLWAKSPRFDLVMLEALYEKVELERPWHFASEDDVRTITRTAGVEPERVEGAHTALGDARAQARHVQRCYWHLNLGIGPQEL